MAIQPQTGALSLQSVLFFCTKERRKRRRRTFFCKEATGAGNQNLLYKSKRILYNKHNKIKVRLGRYKMNTEYTLTASGSGFTETAVLNASTPSAAPFNRYRFLYTASEPLRGKIYYRDHENNPVSEEFYLEAAEMKTAFSSFTDAYLTGKLATEVEKIELSGTSGSSYGVTISSFTTEAAEILTETTVYIEN